MTPRTDAWAGADTILDESACPQCGRDSCEGHEETAASALTFRPAGELIVEPRPVEIIEGIAYAGRVSVLPSEPGAGKTFVLFGQAASVSAGIPWLGRAVRHGSVAYCSYEGDAIGLRLRALRTQGHRLEHVYIIRASDPLSPIVDRDRIELPSRGELTVVGALDALRADLALASRPPLSLLIIDTVRASLSGSEDSSEHVSAYLRVVRRLLTHAPEAAAILAHHAGWQDGDTARKRERGSSAFRGNADITLYLEAGAYDAERGEAQLTLRTLKVRDAERPAPLHLIRRRVELPEMAGDDLRRGPATSCVIEPDRRSREDREAEQAQAADAAQQQADRRILMAIRDRPITSHVALRAHVGGRHGGVVEAVARLLQAGWITRVRQRDPYVLTEAGQAALAEAEP